MVLTIQMPAWAMMAVPGCVVSGESGVADVCWSLPRTKLNCIPFSCCEASPARPSRGSSSPRSR